MKQNLSSAKSKEGNIMKKIYLACPYSNEDEKVRQNRFEQINIIAAHLMRAGNLVFSPISHTHPIAEAGDLPRGWDFWESYDRTFIEWSDVLYIAQFPGYDTSVGIRGEIQIAKSLNRPIVYIIGARCECGSIETEYISSGGFQHADASRGLPEMETNGEIACRNCGRIWWD
jgi:hypothetical protein